MITVTHSIALFWFLRLHHCQFQRKFITAETEKKIWTELRVKKKFKTFLQLMVDTMFLTKSFIFASKNGG